MTDGPAPPTIHRCRICGGAVEECLDFGAQPVSNGFLRPEQVGSEVYFRLAVGRCTACTMVQQLHEAPRLAMFRADYPYRSSQSSVMCKHFQLVALKLLETELTGPDPFVVEIGSNDGIMLGAVRDAGVRHLGCDPSVEAAEAAAANGVRVHTDFFDESSARAIRAADGAADVVFSANTVSHIADIGSVFRGVDALLSPTGVFVVEDRYWADIVANTYFDQIYDEHFYLFSVRAVAAMAARFGFELVDVEHLPVHGGSVRYSMARPGARPVRPSVDALLAEERAAGLAEPATLERFADNVARIRTDLVYTLRRLRAEGRTVVGYGATSKSATVLNSFGIGPDLLPFICDSTPGKQGRLTPGSAIPIRPPDAFSQPYPDYALLLAWNHADEIMAKEQEFRAAGGRWILYMPHVRVIP